jgi:hypothetical protein
MTALWDAAYRLHHQGDNGGSKLRWKVGQYLPAYTVQDQRRQQSPAQISLEEHALVTSVIDSLCSHDEWLSSGVFVQVLPSLFEGIVTAVSHWDNIKTNRHFKGSVSVFVGKSIPAS